MFLFDHTQVADGLVQESLDRFVYSVGGGAANRTFFFAGVLGRHCDVNESASTHQ